MAGRSAADHRPPLAADGWIRPALAVLPIGYMLIYRGGQQFGPWQVTPVVVVGAIIIAALLLAVVAFRINRLRVEVGLDKVRFTSGPLPWPGKTFNVRELSQLHLERGRHGTHARMATLQSGKEVIVAGEIGSWEDGRAIERAVELALGIEDRRMNGEAEPPRDE